MFFGSSQFSLPISGNFPSLIVREVSSSTTVVFTVKVLGHSLPNCAHKVPLQLLETQTIGASLQPLPLSPLPNEGDVLWHDSEPHDDGDVEPVQDVSGMISDFSLNIPSLCFL